MRRCSSGAADEEDPPGDGKPPPAAVAPRCDGVPLLLLCDRMQPAICSSRRRSKSGSVRDGSSRWQTGHSSSSGIWRRACWEARGTAGRARLVWWAPGRLLLLLLPPGTEEPEAMTGADSAAVVGPR